MVQLRQILRRAAGFATVVLSLIAGIRLTEAIIQGHPSAFAALSSKATPLPRPFSIEREKQLPWTFAATLHDEYKQSESEANYKFRWKYYSVVCEVEVASQTDGGEPFVTCKTRDEDSPVYLHFERAWGNELSKLQAKDTIVAVGRPNGLTLGSAHVECVQFRRAELNEGVR